MKAKAIENLTSAQKLINNSQFTSSIHCSYYAVFQYMKYMLAHTTKSPITLSIQDSHTGDSSHEYILTEIQNRIDGNPRSARTFAQRVRKLKNDRVEADYRQKSFTEEESIECRDCANALITNLKTYFGNL